MSEEAIIVEVEPESIKPHLIDVNVSSTVLNEEMPDDINNSEHSNVVAKDTIIRDEDEQADQRDVKKSLVWDVKTHARRHSASLMSGPNKKTVVPSRYRGGSIGSCHDMCKFGHKHTSPEVKPKTHLKRTTPLSINSSEGKGLIKIASSVDNRKKSVLRRLSFPAIKSENENQMHSGKEAVEPKEKLKNAEVVKSSSGDFREIKDIKDEEKPKRLRSKPPVKKAANMSNRVHRDLSSSSQLKNHHQTNGQQEGKAKLPEDVPEKTLYMIEPNSESAAEETSHRNRLVKSQGGSSTGTRKGSKATQNGSYNSRLAKSLFSSSNKSFKWRSEKLEDTELINKRTETVNGHRKSKSSIQEATTLSNTPKLKLGAPKAKQNGKRDSYLIKPLLPAIDKPNKSQEEEELAGTKSVLSKHDDKAKPNNPKAKPSTSTPTSKPGTPKVKQMVEPKAKVTKGAKSQNGEGEGFGSVWKMKFRRGKVVSLPSGNNSPVKLKFRRPKSFSDSRYAENARNVNYKSKEIDGENSQKDGAEPVKVVLRRHEANYKKDDVDLNNVIEETASKLVKTRKSKVKALVGAFETVMSLRDRKSSEATNAS